METYAKQKNRYQCLLLLTKHANLKNNERKYKKMCFNSILINYKVAYDAVMKNTPQPPLFPF